MGSFDKSKVHNLPAHAQIQTIRGTIYVYFAYCFSINGKRKQERDYIGVVDTDNMKFVPNGFFLREKPSFQHRALSRWKDPDKRKREESKRLVKENKKPTFSIQLMEYLPQLNILNQINEAQEKLFEFIREAPWFLKTVDYGNRSDEEEQEKRKFGDRLEKIDDSFREVARIFEPVFRKLALAESARESGNNDQTIKEKVKKQSDALNIYLLFQLFDQLSRSMEATWALARESGIKSYLMEDTIGILGFLRNNFQEVTADLKERFDMDGIYNILIASQYLSTPREE